MDKVTINKEVSDVYPRLNLESETGIVTVFPEKVQPKDEWKYGGHDFGPDKYIIIQDNTGTNYRYASKEEAESPNVLKYMHHYNGDVEIVDANPNYNERTKVMYNVNSAIGIDSSQFEEHVSNTQTCNDAQLVVCVLEDLFKASVMGRTIQDIKLKNASGEINKSKLNVSNNELALKKIDELNLSLNSLLFEFENGKSSSVEAYDISAHFVTTEIMNISKNLKDYDGGELSDLKFLYNMDTFLSYTNDGNIIKFNMYPSNKDIPAE